jgi:hypothetical protein
VLLVHPSVFVPRLAVEGKVTRTWMESYTHRQLETGEQQVATPGPAA